MSLVLNFRSIYTINIHLKRKFLCYSHCIILSTHRPDDQTVDTSVASHGGSRQYGLEQASNDSSNELTQVDELLQDTNGKIDSVKVLLACGDPEANKS